MRPRAATVSLAALIGLAPAACRSDKPAAAAAPDAAATPAASAASPVVTVTASDFSFDAPAEVPAGAVTFRLVNRGPSLHHVQLVKLEEGKTPADFVAALKAGGPPPAWATLAGGPNPPEMPDTASTTLMLQPGSYAMLCFIPGTDGIPHVMKGMIKPLTVTAASGPAAEPVAGVVMKLVDYGFELSAPLAAGPTTVRIENAGAQPHEVAIVRLADGKEPMDFAEWGEKMVGTPPGTLAGGTSAIMPGAHAFVNLNLRPGEYGLICFVPDMKDGKGHYRHGMVKKITVGAAGSPAVSS
ncbi:MAG TPA: hypothetical protein VFT84_07515 [Gemmatimonadales bacterium]|nr:hypothetical protein [Gemmatimonadales bacterium]